MHTFDDAPITAYISVLDKPTWKAGAGWGWEDFRAPGRVAVLRGLLCRPNRLTQACALCGIPPNCDQKNALTLKNKVGFGVKRTRTLVLMVLS